MMERMDNSLLASISVSEGKARTAVGFRRPSKALDDAIAGGGAALRVLSIQGEGVFVQGGLPIVVDGKVVGAIGVSGGSSQQDEQVAQAGLTPKNRRSLGLVTLPHVHAANLHANAFHLA